MFLINSWANGTMMIYLNTVPSPSPWHIHTAQTLGYQIAGDIHEHFLDEVLKNKHH